jgi:hypothetical protein
MNRELKATMHFHDLRVVTTIAWLTLIFALTASYAIIAAGLVGLVSAAIVSLGSFGGAMIGCVAALVYLASAMRKSGAAHSM